MSFTDPIDQASYLNGMHNQSALERHRLRNKPQQVKVLVSKEGEDEVWDWPIKECGCGEEIEPARLEDGRIRCFACQTLYEEKEKGFARR